MKVLFLKEVAGSAKAGDVKEVAAGYARNYLVPRGLALKASSGSQKQADAMRRNREARERRDREAAQALAAQFEGRTIIRLGVRQERAGQEKQRQGRAPRHAAVGQQPAQHPGQGWKRCGFR